tara:strand:- start:127 stop:288 length:162 start_codon:yes stop_codon:yes gene_type:complete
MVQFLFGGRIMSEQYHIKGWFYAFLVCAFMIIGVPIIINLLIWPDVGIWSIIK